MKHLGTKTLESKRLILRKFIIEDAEDMFNNWANDSDVTKYLTWKPHASISVTRDTLSTWIENYDKSDFYNWVIVLKDIKKAIGSISVVKNDDNIQMVHIGYCLAKPYWNKGIMSEALSRVIKFFFEEVGINKIESMHNVANPSSGKVMLNCNMKIDGILRQSAVDNSGIYDAKYYSILKDEYFER